jgi:Uma2 family endonuclease
MSTTVATIPTTTITPAEDTLPVPSSHLLGSLYRMTIDRYEQLVKSGALDDLKVELIQGWHTEKEEPVRIPDFDEPEPDVAVVSGALEDHVHPPGPGNLALLVEVADSTLDRDQDEKRNAYARGNIPVYWMINLIDRQVEVYTNPRAGRYQDSHIYPAGSEVPVAIAGVEVGRIAVDAILPPAPQA